MVGAAATGAGATPAAATPAATTTVTATATAWVAVLLLRRRGLPVAQGEQWAAEGDADEVGGRAGEVGVQERHLPDVGRSVRTEHLTRAAEPVARAGAAHRVVDRAERVEHRDVASQAGGVTAEGGEVEVVRGPGLPGRRAPDAHPGRRPGGQHALQDIARGIGHGLGNDPVAVARLHRSFWPVRVRILLTAIGRQ